MRKTVVLLFLWMPLATGGCESLAKHAVDWMLPELETTIDSSVQRISGVSVPRFLKKPISYQLSSSEK